jgi:hypothetical protein
LIEEIEHLAILAGAADKHKQEQPHQPSRRFLDTRRRVGERELDQGVDVPFLGELLLIPRHPRRWHRPINVHARFVDGDFAKSVVVASHFQSNQSTVAVANEQGGSRLRLQGEHVLTLFTML